MLIDTAANGNDLFTVPSAAPDLRRLYEAYLLC